MRELEGLDDYKQFESLFHVLLREFDTRGLNTVEQNGPVSLYFKRITKIIQTLSAEEAYKILHFFYYLLASFEENAGARAALQLTDVCQINLIPLFQLIPGDLDDENNSEEEKQTILQSAIDLQAHDFFFESGRWIVAKENKRWYPHHFLGDNKIRVDAGGHVFFKPAVHANAEYMKGCKSVSLDTIKIELFIWYVKTIKKIQNHYQFITALPLDFFKIVDLRKYATPQQLMSEVAATCLAEEKENSAIVSSFKNLLLTAPEYLETDTLIDFAERFVPEEERSAFLRSSLDKLSEKTDLVRTIDSLELNAASRLLACIDKYKVFDIAMFYIVSSRLRLTEFMGGYIQKNNLAFFSDFDITKLPPWKVASMERIPPSLQRDFQNEFELSELQAGEAYLFKNYQHKLANHVINEEKLETKEEVLHSTRLFYIPCAVTGLVSRGNGVAFVERAQLEALVNSVGHDESLVFCGIAHVDEEDLIPFFIYKNDIVFISVKSAADKVFQESEMMNAKVRRAFSDLLPGKVCKDPCVIQSIQRRREGWAALTFLEWAIRFFGTEKAPIFSVRKGLQWNIKRFPYDFNRYAWDKDNSGFLYYSPIIHTEELRYTELWLERLKIHEKLPTVFYDGNISLQSQFRLISLDDYQIAKNKIKFLFSRTFGNQGHLSKMIETVKALSESGLVALSLQQSITDFYQRLAWPSLSITNRYCDEISASEIHKEVSRKDPVLHWNDYVASSIWYYMRREQGYSVITHYVNYFMRDYSITQETSLLQVLKDYFLETKIAELFLRFNLAERVQLFNVVSPLIESMLLEKRRVLASNGVGQIVWNEIAIALDAIEFNGVDFATEIQLKLLHDYYHKRADIQKIIASCPEKDRPTILAEHVRAAFSKFKTALYDNTLKRIVRKLQDQGYQDFSKLIPGQPLLFQLRGFLSNYPSEIILLQRNFDKTRCLMYGVVLQLALDMEDALQKLIMEQFTAKLDFDYPQNRLQNVPKDFILDAYFDPETIPNLISHFPFDENASLYAYAYSHLLDLYQKHIRAYLKDQYQENYALLQAKFTEEPVTVRQGAIDVASLVFHFFRKKQAFDAGAIKRYTDADLFSKLFAEDLSVEVDKVMAPFVDFWKSLNRAALAIVMINSAIRKYPGAPRLEQPLAKPLANLMCYDKGSIKALIERIPEFEEATRYLLKSYFRKLMKDYQSGYMGGMHFTHALRMLLAHIFGLTLPQKETLPSCPSMGEIKWLDGEINKVLSKITLKSFVNFEAPMNLPSYSKLRKPDLEAGEAHDFKMLKRLIFKWYESYADKKPTGLFQKFYNSLSYATLSDETKELSEGFCASRLRPLLQDKSLLSEMQKHAGTKKFVLSLLHFQPILSSQEQILEEEKLDVDQEGNVLISFSHLRAIQNLYLANCEQKQIEEFVDMTRCPTGNSSAVIDWGDFNEQKSIQKKSLIKRFSVWVSPRNLKDSLDAVISLMHERHQLKNDFILDRGDAMLLQDLLIQRWQSLKAKTGSPKNYLEFPEAIDRIHLLIALLLKSALRNLGVSISAYELLTQRKFTQCESQADSIDDYQYSQVIVLRSGIWLDRIKLEADYRELHRLRDHFTKKDLSAEDVEGLLTDYKELKTPLLNIFISIYHHVFDEEIKVIFMEYLKCSVFARGWISYYNNEQDAISKIARDKMTQQVQDLPGWKRKILLNTEIPMATPMRTLDQVLEGKVVAHGCITYLGLDVAKILWRYYPEIKLTDFPPAFEHHYKEISVIPKLSKEECVASEAKIQPNEAPLEALFMLEQSEQPIFIPLL